jgi:hypothetical protein
MEFESKCLNSEDIGLIYFFACFIFDFGL